MEIKSGNYLIIYCANSSDFRISIYNNITTKKYETIKTSDDYKMYTDIGLDIFEIIKNCLDNNTFRINDNNDYLTLLLFYKELIKISINCDNLRIDKKEIELFDLKNDINELKNIIQKQDSILEKLKPFYDVVSIDNIKMNKKETEILELKKDVSAVDDLVNRHNNILIRLKPFYDNIITKLIFIDNITFHKDIQEIHINKLTQKYEKDYWNDINSSKISIPIIHVRSNYMSVGNISIKAHAYGINTDSFADDMVMIKTPKFRKYHKYPEIPKIYFSDTIKIKELTDDLQNLTLIGLSYFDISHVEIKNLLRLKNLTQIKFYKCNFINISQQTIIYMLEKIKVIFSL